jgi:hypothetical protein
MRDGTRVRRDKARRATSAKNTNTCAPKLLAQDCPTHAVGPVNLKDVLRQIQPDCDNLRFDHTPWGSRQTHLGT